MIPMDFPQYFIKLQIGTVDTYMGGPENFYPNCSYRLYKAIADWTFCVSKDLSKPCGPTI